MSKVTQREIDEAFEEEREIKKEILNNGIFSDDWKDEDASEYDLLMEKLVNNAWQTEPNMLEWYYQRRIQIWNTMLAIGNQKNKKLQES